MIHHVAGLETVHEADLVIVNTPLIDYIDKLRAYDAEDLLPPLGLGYIATEAMSRGHNVGLLDAEALGISVDDIADTINTTRPRYVGINVLTPTIGVLDQIMSRIDPEIAVILGGAHATALPEDLARTYSANGRETIVVSGEGEYVVGDILDGKNPRLLPGTYWSNDGSIKRNLLGPTRATSYEDLDSAPNLDRRFLINDPATDAHTGLREARMLATRGCPFTCKFCSGARDALGQPLRKRANGEVVKEILDLQDSENIQSVRLIDDLFMRSEPQVMSFLDDIEAHGVNVQFDVTSRVNIMNKFSPELWGRLSGRLHEVSVGIEHGVKSVRDTAEKGILDEHIFNTLDRGCSRGVKFKLYGIVGLPDVTREQELESINFFKNLIRRHPGMVRASLFRFRPYPGTKYWDELIERGWTKEQMLSMAGDETQSDDKRARHSVVTGHSFGEPSVEELTDMLIEFNNWQNDYLSK